MARNFWDELERKGLETYNVPSLVLNPPEGVREGRGIIVWPTASRTALVSWAL